MGRKANAPLQLRPRLGPSAPPAAPRRAESAVQKGRKRFLLRLLLLFLHSQWLLFEKVSTGRKGSTGRGKLMREALSTKGQERIDETVTGSVVSASPSAASAAPPESLPSSRHRPLLPLLLQFSRSAPPPVLPNHHSPLSSAA